MAKRRTDPLAPQEIHGRRRAWTIQLLHESSPLEITPQHVRAAQRLLRDYVIGGGGQFPAVLRIHHLGRYQQAIETLGTQGGLIVSLVAIDNWTVTRLANALGIDRSGAFGRLQAGLQHLREHYWPVHAKDMAAFSTTHGAPCHGERRSHP